MTRFQLQNAPAVAVARLAADAARKEELTGQVWAESVYTSARRAAEEGLTSMVFCFSQHMTTTAKNYGLARLRELFPDSDFTIPQEGSICTISWAPKEAQPVTNLDDRRLEKETSW
jgi:hypothetical protein